MPETEVIYKQVVKHTESTVFLTADIFTLPKRRLLGPLMLCHGSFNPLKETTGLDVLLLPPSGTCMMSQSRHD